jgi:Mn2+/Fe2+ NRAMP family transporter
MVKTIEPLAGSFASAIFIMGIVGAGVSSLIPTILIAPWLLSDFNNSKINPKSKRSRIFVIIGLLIALAAPFFRTEPVILMIITMALLAIILPLTTISITILLNQKKYMGKNRNSFIMNIGCGAAVIFSIVMCYYGIVGLFRYF